MISKNLTQRIVVAVIFIPIILFLIFRGGDWFLYFILLLTAVGIAEYLIGGRIPVASPFFIIPFMGTVGAVYLGAIGQPVQALYILLFVFMMMALFLSIGRDPIDNLFYRMTYLTWGSFYLGLLYPFVYLIRGDASWMQPPDGRWWMFFLLSAIWLGDTAAFFFGSRFGKHRLAPAVSPNKTFEGFLGEFVGIFLAAVIFKIFWLKEVSPRDLIYISLLIGFFGQFGDLVESLWKRSIGIKDSSNLIPGHGGVLDRFDSLLFSAPVVYLYMKFVMQVSWL